VIYRFSYHARVFVRLEWKKLTSDKHSSLLQKSVIFGQKRFMTLGPDALPDHNATDPGRNPLHDLAGKRLQWTHILKYPCITCVPAQTLDDNIAQQFRPKENKL
jgi:hypothetical protein